MASQPSQTESLSLPPPPPSQNSSQPQTQPESSPYESLHTYPFSQDAEFKLGLAAILRQQQQPSQTPISDEDVQKRLDSADAASSGVVDELVLRAKCFYYSKKHSISPPLTPQSYKTYISWLSPSTTTTTTTPPQPSPQPQQSQQQQQQPPPDTDPEPAYPSSFAHIVSLITSGQPIPGIQEIPDTLLTGKDQPSAASRRKKPWEKDESEIEIQTEAESGTGTAAAGGGGGGGEAGAGENLTNGNS
ncbi:hypothetical protein AJ80_02747 [Polytolypa hystricis UAMH7299]|uniref:Uncharacterized protein n=1 Tax=Polytolypa hystricis (strain UAMH7299) TaxID=1447883 RepID=A0A2B7YQ09_POLH7|nr:hypothetical protein AJ80_02747 [Polytolypa hystricis UAMH7299]